jgi:threonine dehydrogenase-like Zn-dependent dehydrogenase
VFIADILPTGFAAIERGGVKNQDVVVVLGCGPVGLMTILSAVSMCRTVIAVDSIPARRDMAAQLGALAVDPGEALETVLQLTLGYGADVVVEASGSVAGLDSSLHLARPQGVISVVGAHFEPDFPLNNAVMFEKELTLMFSVGNPSKDREKLFSSIESGALDPQRIISHTLPMGDAPKAYKDFDEKRALKIVLTP